MWTKTSSGFGDASPVLFKKERNFGHDSTLHSTLEDIYKKIIKHLKKSEPLCRKELTQYLEKIQKCNPPDYRSKWLVMKISGLLYFILKKRSVFQEFIANGEITVTKKSLSQESYNSEFSESSAISEVPSSLLSNNNFVTIENNYDMEIEQNYNSEDMFLERLHNYSQENYNTLKNCVIPEDKAFKVPFAVDKVEKIIKIHEKMEESYNSLVTLTQACPKMEQSFEGGVNIFDNLDITNDELKEDFEKELENVKNFISLIGHNLISLKIEDENPSNITEFKENAQVLNESTSSVGSLLILPHYSEENRQIISEACSRYKKNLETSQDKNDLQELLNLSF